MKDPLTKKQHREFLKGIQDEYYREYQKVLAGTSEIAVSVVRDAPARGSHVLARIALSQVAKSYRLLGFQALQAELADRLGN